MDKRTWVKILNLPLTKVISKFFSLTLNQFFKAVTWPTFPVIISHYFFILYTGEKEGTILLNKEGASSPICTQYLLNLSVTRKFLEKSMSLYGKFFAN